jgi:hypothetical protein
MLIAKDLSLEESELLSFLDKNNNAFVWSISDLTDIRRNIIEHKLYVNPLAKPKKQKLYKVLEKHCSCKSRGPTTFVHKLHQRGWVPNMASKCSHGKEEKWKICTNFTDLNKCCPKYDFPLSRIDKVVDSVVGCEMMTLLDYFSGYHHIWLHKEDKEKTSFITPFDTYCYIQMSEGLKNDGPTFCRMMKATLKNQIGRNIFTYVDDIVVASKKTCTHIGHQAPTCVEFS